MLTFKFLITEHIIFWNLELGYSVPYYPLAAYLEATHSHPLAFTTAKVPGHQLRGKYPKVSAGPCFRLCVTLG